MIIEGFESPTEYEFDVGLPDGATMRVDEAGSIAMLSREGVYLGGIARPWAVNSDGATVSTRLEVSGNRVTQHVEHRSISTQYPVIADPWLGLALYRHPAVSNSPKGYKINVVPTAWGTQNGNNASIWWAHRDEVKTKLGGDAWRWTSTIQEQFYCHLAGLPASLPEYNLESWRPLRGWADQLTKYRCNEPEGYWF